MRLFKRIRRGQALLEYALIITIISLAAVVIGGPVLGGPIQSIFSTVSSTIGGGPPLAPPPDLNSIQIAPSGASVEVGATPQFTATAYYSDGSYVVNPDTLSWASSDSSVAEIDESSGLATAHAVGDIQIFATLGDMTGATALHVIYTGETAPIADWPPPPSGTSTAGAGSGNDTSIASSPLTGYPAATGGFGGAGSIDIFWNDSPTPPTPPTTVASHSCPNELGSHHPNDCISSSIVDGNNYDAPLVYIEHFTTSFSHMHVVVHTAPGPGDNLGGNGHGLGGISDIGYNVYITGPGTDWRAFSGDDSVPGFLIGSSTVYGPAVDVSVTPLSTEFWIWVVPIGNTCHNGVTCTAAVTISLTGGN